jgi:hypothetical protein
MKSNTTGSITRDLELAKAAQKDDLGKRLARLGPISMFCFRAGEILGLVAILGAIFVLMWSGIKFHKDIFGKLPISDLGINESTITGELLGYFLLACICCALLYVFNTILMKVSFRFACWWSGIWLPELPSDHK